MMFGFGEMRMRKAAVGGVSAASSGGQRRRCHQHHAVDEQKTPSVNGR